jgi:hypothetical protein
MPGKQALEKRYGPSLQSLGENGVVRVRKDLANDLPRLSEFQVFFIYQNSLELGHGDSRMSVVQLDRNVVGQGGVRKIELLEPSKNVLQGSRAPEVLLLQSELLALVGVVVRVEDSSNGLGG